MAKTSDYSQSEIKSGFLVFISFAVLLGLLFMSGNYTPFQKTRQVQLQFNYISGLEKNAPVQVAGYPVGKVKEIRFVDQNMSKVVVTIDVSDKVILKSDAEAFINVAGFMGEMFVELSPGSYDAPPLSETAVIVGFDPIPLMELVKKGAELTEEFEKITKSLKGLVASLEEVVGENKPELNGIFSNLESATTNLNEMTYDLKHHPWKLLRKGKEKSFDELLEREAAAEKS